jgi:site-specific DNA-cytosine methylase
VLAIHKEGKDDGERIELIENVKNVLTGGIKDEYEKVKKILNENHIYFDFYWMMKEGGEKMKRVYPE